MKVYFFAFILLLFQVSIISKFFSFEGIIPDFLTIFVIIFTLKSKLKDAIKLAIFIGFLEDILSPIGFLFNTLTKVLIVLVTNSYKEKFFYSSIVIQGLLIIVVTLIDIGMKTSIIFLRTGIFEISYQDIVYVFLNFITFYIVSFIDEFKQS